MALPPNQMPLPGSALATPSAPCRGPLPPREQVDLVVRLRPGLDGRGVDAVVAFAVEACLTVLGIDRLTGTVELRGPVGAVSRAFGVQLRSYEGPDGAFRARRGLVHIPVTLAGVIVGVDGLDQRPRLPRRPGTRRRTGGRSHPGTTRGRPAAAPRTHSPTLSLSAAPRVRAGRTPPDPADDAGSGLAVVLHIPSPPERRWQREGRDVSAPLDDDQPGAAPDPVPPVALAAARAHRRGPLVRAAADQRDRRLARQLHPARERDT